MPYIYSEKRNEEGTNTCLKKLRRFFLYIYVIHIGSISVKGSTLYMLLSYFSFSAKVNYDYFKIYKDEMKLRTQENIHQIISRNNY